MCGNDILLSWKRIETYFRKYWWILICSIFIGVFILIKFAPDSQENGVETTIDFIYEVDYLLVSNELKVDELSSMVGNCELLIRTDTIVDEINDKAGIKILESAEQLSCVRPSGGSGFALKFSLNGKDEEELEKKSIKLAEIFPLVLEEELNKYYPTVTIEIADQHVYSSEKSENVISEFNIKGIMGFMGCCVLGLLIIYLIIIFSPEIVCEAEVESILGKKCLMVIGENTQNFKAWINYLRKNKENVLFFLCTEVNTIKPILNEYEQKFVEQGDFEYGKGNNLILVMRKEKITFSELINIKHQSKIYGDLISGFIFLK